MNPIKTIQKGNKRLKIIIDEDPINPREWDNFGIMVCFHNHYDLPNEAKLNPKDFNGFDDLKAHIMKTYKTCLILPIYMLDHSGITIKTESFNDPWDSGQIGFIYVTNEQMKKEKVSNNQALKILKREIETYDQYLRGAVYGYQLFKISKCSLNEEHEELIDSCYGFYGDSLEDTGILEHIGKPFYKEDNKNVST